MNTLYTCDLFEIIEIEGIVYYCFDEGGSDNIKDLINYLKYQER